MLRALKQQNAKVTNKGIRASGNIEEFERYIISRLRGAVASPHTDSARKITGIDRAGRVLMILGEAVTKYGVKLTWSKDWDMVVLGAGSKSSADKGVCEFVIYYETGGDLGLL